MKMNEMLEHLKSWYRFISSRIPPLESAILLTSFLAAAGIWGFVELADEMLEGETHHIDKEIILALRNPADLSDPVGPLWFEEMMRDFTALGGITVLTALCLAAAGFLMLQNKKGMALFMTVSVLSGLLLSTVLKFGFDRPRPDLVPHDLYVFSASFPSGHSMLSAIVFLTLGGLLARYTSQKRLKLYILVLSLITTLLVGFSRIYLGVHWPSDVLAGWTAGSSWALISWMLAILLQSRGQIEQEN
ncbi:phosphatase PAP2 family protein [Desulfopila inferna]|uniref:phosphatase PAP2 family protein n=1 Tax=Desulfopila inferna TaxID=468528 RepID=UPI001962E0F5|nr:phosphatase PAP2 family protein [Desulfopila inferna]MBM9605014.1 phosphatase PAP2 family protein [Desulfopila inferna]